MLIYTFWSFLHLCCLPFHDNTFLPSNNGCVSARNQDARQISSIHIPCLSILSHFPWTTLIHIPAVLLPLWRLPLPCCIFCQKSFLFTQYFKYWFIRYSGTYNYTWNMLIRKRLLDTSATHYAVSRPIFMMLRSLFVLVNHLQHIWIFPLCQKFVLFHWIQPNLYENILIAVHLYSSPDMATRFCIFIADQVQHLSIFTTFLKYISFIAKIPYISINNPWLAYRQDSGCC